MSKLLNRMQIRRLWEQALAEDGFERDVTSLIAVSESVTGTAQLVAKSPGVFGGSVMFDVLSEALPGRVTIAATVEDGAALSPGLVIATIQGPLRLLLGVERTLLNFLQRLCGVATLTRRYVDAVAGTGAKIYDTRKTVPGWRELDKYAVRCGGGSNHRSGLHDAILVKDNHIAGVETARLASCALDMLNQAILLNPPPSFVEFEVDTLDQLGELLKVVGIDVILLDNFTIDQMRAAVRLRDEFGLKGKVQLEASGGISLDSLRAIAETGIERIAVGAITHSAPAVDISMEIVPAT